MRTKPTTVDPVVAFRSKHEQLRDVYYFVLDGQLVTVQAVQIDSHYLRRRSRSRHIDQLTEETAKKIALSIETVARGCDPNAYVKHLFVAYSHPAACGVIGKRANTLNEVDCPDCLIRMYQMAIANPFVSGGAQP